MTGRRGRHKQARKRRWIAVAAVAAAVCAAGGGGYAYLARVSGGHATAAASTRPPAPSPARTTPPATPLPCTVSAILVPSCGAWWGMYLPVSTDQQLPGAVQAEEGQLGRPLDIVMRYHDMSQSDDGIFPDAAEQQVGQHHLMIFSWAPAVWAAHTTFRWQTIASGALDSSVIVPEAERLRAYGHPVFLSFAPESDTPAAVPGEGSPQQYVAAWRHIHDVFDRVGARNVIWVWTTEGYFPHYSRIAAMYPGNAYVDWIGWDPYNFYTCHHNGWHSFASTVTPFYRWLMANHFGDKPFMLPEFGTQANASNPALEAAWYASVVPVIRGLPNLKALVNWNSTVRGCQLALSSSPAGMDAYRKTGTSPYLRQKLP